MLCQRIGHGGASALARANTLASFDAACDIGVDMVEFDVRAWDGELVLAHTVLHARRGGNLRLDDALSHLRGRRVELNVDVKHAGCEAALLESVRRAGLLHRTLISSQVPDVLDRVRALEPRARVGISVGGRIARLGGLFRKYGDTESGYRRMPGEDTGPKVWPSHIEVRGQSQAPLGAARMSLYLRKGPPGHRWRDWRAVALAGLHTGRWDALMAQHKLVDRALLHDVSDRGGRLYAWTVNDRAAIARLAGLGVHGITTADPRLFG
jgi:glycerophosphoryl diester phosphodiesterase